MRSTLRLAALSLSLLLLFNACKKNKDMQQPQPTHDENTITAVGIPDGNPTTQTIDANGGQITSEDGTVTVIIPAGALSNAKEISIQAITNQLPCGIGHAYRITPHGEQFNTEVSIVFNYKAEDTFSTLPEFLDIAFQDAHGTWQAMTNTVVDKVNRKLTVTTTHFSDWTYFKSLTFTPAQATTDVSGSVNLKVTTTFPLLDPDDAPPGTTTRPVYTTPRLLRPDEILGWTYQGEGILISRTAEGFYTAPDHIPAANPEAVAVNIKMHRKGQFMLISNITVLGNNGVDYLRVDEDYLKAGNNGQPVLYLYGHFGNNPGAGNGSVKIDGNDMVINVWSPTIIVCRIDREISGAIEIIANNHTVATSVLRKFTGSFLYTRYHGGVLNSGNPDALKETSRFDLVYRGFGAPCPANVDQLFQFDAGLAKGTEAHFTFSGSAAVTMPGTCPYTTSVSLPTSSGLQPVNPLSVNGDSHFKCIVNDVEGGIDVTFDYNINNVVTGVIVTRTNCNGSSQDNPRSLSAGIEGFHNQPISMAFDGVTGLKLKGTNELTSFPISSGILIEAWDGTGNPSHYETDGLMPATFGSN